MIQLPPIPDWDQLHPLVIHFPSALLLVTPVFVILGAILSPPQGRSFLTSALIMMTAGTITLFVALETGDAAGGLVVQTAQIKQALEQHERSAETTCLLFSALTLVFAHLVMVPRILKREFSRKVSTSLLAAFLILYGTGALFLWNAAQQGGCVVHAFGVDGQALPSAQSAILPMPANPDRPTAD